jgi:hypothetical protein
MDKAERIYRRSNILDHELLVIHHRENRNRRILKVVVIVVIVLVFVGLISFVGNRFANTNENEGNGVGLSVPSPGEGDWDFSCIWDPLDCIPRIGGRVVEEGNR